MKIELKKPITLAVSYEHGMWEIYCKELDSYSVSSISCASAVDEFFKVMKTYYDIYVEDNSMELTKDATDLREKLMEYFRVTI